MNDINTLKKKFILDKENTYSNYAISVNTNGTNVVSGEILRHIQLNTLKDTAKYLSNTFGPMGSNTKIIKGNNKDNITSCYSKDGLNVLKNIANSNPIEASIVEELIDITRHIESEVGDGTTSTVILSSLIFEKLISIEEKHKIPPYQLMSRFKSIVDNIKNIILNHSHKCTLEDIKDICMISTNSNIEITDMIMQIYDKYGLDVDLSVGISNDKDNKVKAYDGLTITEGYADPSYINNKLNSTSEIHNARVYYFKDPIDTMEMISYFEKIIIDNIYEPLKNDKPPIPTVIASPKITRDADSVTEKLATSLYSYDTAGSEMEKPPILVLNNIVGSDEEVMNDIAMLCNCKPIKKYIDPKVQKKEIEEGIAPTLDTISENFYGECELVVSDLNKTKFINPSRMFIYNEDGSVTPDPIYTTLLNFLEGELNQAKLENAKAGEISLLKKRISSLKSNMVEFLVGGVTISERDSIKDLVEDAVKNCRSAVNDGVGYAANFEALRAINEFKNGKEFDNIDNDILEALYLSYIEIQETLYSSVCNDIDKIDEYILYSIETNADRAPYNISSGYLSDDKEKYDTNVKCSIMLDINILDTLSKILSIMVTCNQCLLQAPQLNKYI